MTEKKYGPIEARYTTTPSGHPDINVKDGPIKPATVLGGPEKAGVTSFGIFMDAAGPKESRVRTQDTKLEMNIPSALL